MLSKILIGLGVLAAGLGVGAFWITRDDPQVIPEGSGRVMTASGEFEGFDLPDYASAVLPADIKSYFIEVEPGVKIHMLEIGEGYPVYLQHGNPTNGLLYRKVAAELPTDRMRLIMPTMVGLGFSTKIPASEHTFENHLRWMSEAIRQLKLDDAVFVAQDWGGAIGMGAMMNNPGLVKGAVIMNTGFSAPQEKMSLSTPHAIAATPIIGELVLENLVSIFDNLDSSQGDPASIGPEVSALYARPVIESGSTKGPLALMRMVPTGPDHPTTRRMRDVQAYAETLGDIPVELVWGMKDPILAKGLPRMQQFFPDAPLTKTDAGHFLQEEVPVEIASAIIRVVDKAQSGTAAEPPVAD